MKSCLSSLDCYEAYNTPGLCKSPRSNQVYANENLVTMVGKIILTSSTRNLWRLMKTLSFDRQVEYIWSHFHQRKQVSQRGDLYFHLKDNNKCALLNGTSLLKCTFVSCEKKQQKLNDANIIINDNYNTYKVRKVYNAVHWINHYLVDSVVCAVNTYPQDSDQLSAVQRYQAFERPGFVENVIRFNPSLP